MADALDNSICAASTKLNPGLQREYAEYISSAKREVTVARRRKKIKPMILKGG